MPVYYLNDGRGNQRCFLYIGVPKTGNTTLHRAFTNDGWIPFYDQRQNNLTVYGALKCPAQHFHAPMLETLFNLKAFDDVFMVVRHPVRRMVSDYLWMTRNKDANSRPRFDHWVDWILRQYQANPYIGDNHIRPQAEYVVPEARVFRYEDGLETVVASVYRRLGVSKRTAVAVPRENTSEDQTGLRSRDVIVPDATRAKIEAVYARDFELFGYEMSGVQDGEAKIPDRAQASQRGP